MESRWVLVPCGRATNPKESPLAKIQIQLSCYRDPGRGLMERNGGLALCDRVKVLEDRPQKATDKDTGHCRDPSILEMSVPWDDHQELARAEWAWTYEINCVCRRLGNKVHQDNPSQAFPEAYIWHWKMRQNITRMVQMQNSLLGYSHMWHNIIFPFCRILTETFEGDL